MQGLIGALVAAFAGIVLGFWLRAASNKAEKAQLERRTAELADEVAAARTELARVQAESAARAGFESLAAEREKTIASRRRSESVCAPNCRPGARRRAPRMRA